jgi:hypothetical protein
MLEGSVNNNTESGYTKNFRNANLNFVYDNLTNKYTVQMRPKNNLFSEPKSKNIEFKVVLDESGEILEGKKQLEENNILGLRKLNRKEEIVINIRELVDLYVMEEISRILIKFDPLEEKSRYEELYKNNYKKIISCKFEN